MKLRIISLVPAETELLCDLGLQEQIIGVTKECIHPFYINQTKEIVSKNNAIDFDKIKSLKADIILCNTSSHSEDIIQKCKEITETHCSKIETIDDVIQLISSFGEKFNCRTTADNLIFKLKFKFKDFMSFIKGCEWQKVAFFINENPWKIASGNSYTNHLLSLNNFRNIYHDKENMSEVKIKKIRLEGDPDCVFLSSNHTFTDENVFELGRFTHHAKTVFVDHTMFTWGGSRLLKAFEYFKDLHKRIGDAHISECGNH